VLFPRGDGDGWTHCAHGHKHWGLFGAAGLLLWHDDRILLQHRALWSHHGGTWGVLGGARNRGESPEQAALREAGEEAGVDAADVVIGGTYVDDHGGWTYTTVIARTGSPLVLDALTAETIEVRWVPAAALRDLPLHPGFAASWARVSAAVPPGRD
jgi:8-oxo-dGTP pyrophosphatase MutT (NUDIX family)